VVSVPVDSSEEKLRVCRYRVMDVVTSEDRSMLYLGDLDRRTRHVEPLKAVERAQEASKGSAPAKAKKKAPKAAQAPQKLPEFYEHWTAKHFETMSFNDLRWLAKEWEMKTGSNPTKPALIEALVAEGKARRKTWAKK
jgi:hypothetical protein